MRRSVDLRDFNQIIKLYNSPIKKAPAYVPVLGSYYAFTLLQKLPFLRIPYTFEANTTFRLHNKAHIKMSELKKDYLNGVLASNLLTVALTTYGLAAGFFSGGLLLGVALGLYVNSGLFSLLAYIGRSALQETINDLQKNSNKTDRGCKVDLYCALLGS